MTKLDLIERHGTLDEFAKAVWAAQAQNFCDAQEAVDAIAAYARELAHAALPQARVVDPDHVCASVMLNPNRVDIPEDHYEQTATCESGCCTIFSCRHCGARIEVNRQLRIVRALPEAD